MNKNILLAVVVFGIVSAAQSASALQPSVMKPAAPVVRPQSLPLPSPPVTVSQPVATTAQSLVTNAGVVGEPNWPQRFDLTPGEPATFGFMAGQPGPIVIHVQSQGVPLHVSLVKPGGGSVDWQGGGNLNVNYLATADDVGRGVTWVVRLTPVPSSAKMSSTLVVGGSIIVQHPPVDAKQAQAALSTLAQKAKALPANRPAPAQVDLLGQKRAALNTEQASRHMVLLNQIQSKIPPTVQQTVAQKIKLSGQGKLLAGTAVSSSQYADTGAPGGGNPPPNGGIQAVGANSSAIVSVSVPSVTSVSVHEGDPGTPVLIQGSGLSDTPGTVHFIVANGRDLVAPVTRWTANQILVEVPYTEGVPIFNGYVYVKRIDGPATDMQPFRFLPPVDVAMLPIPMDQGGRVFDSLIIGYPSDFSFQYKEVVHSTDWFLGKKGDDQFYLQSRLKNGWWVDSVMIMDYWNNPYFAGDEHSNVTVAEFRPNSDSPYVKVHWWVDPSIIGGLLVEYKLQVTIKGPKGLPYF